MALPAYWAGLFDGEGCITITTDKRANKGKGVQTLRVRVNMCDERVIAALNTDYPGSVWEVNHLNPKHLTTYCWQLSGGKAKQFLIDILPCVVSKKDVILLALQFIETLGKNRGTLTLDETTWNIREQIKTEVHRLNQET